MEKLFELAGNVWSTWDAETIALFREIDENLFEKLNRNPIHLLEEISDEKFVDLENSEQFSKKVAVIYDRFITYLEKQSKQIDSQKIIAYLSMEYGLHESIPIYSGGLGILSGDHLKASSDAGLPLVAFGLLYRFGYFQQKIENGEQKEYFVENDWETKMVFALEDENGDDLIIPLFDGKIKVKVWQIDVGNIPLYLFDTNLPENSDKVKTITDYLYVADREMRLLQEMVLAFGAFELMKIFNVKSDVYHLNEGHSAFIIIRRLQHLINNKKMNFKEAMQEIRKSTIFTTHTPVPAGNESFQMKLVEQYLSDEIKQIGMNFNEFKKYAIVPNDENNFSLGALAIRFSKYINGVSQLHAKVSRQMWNPLFPNTTIEKTPIIGITNGVHTETWVNPKISKLYQNNIFEASDKEIENAHKSSKKKLINCLQQNGNFNLNENFLTIGFARRFATYKRANLILSDEQRLLKLLNNKKYPIQFVFAGKAHPADENGKALLKTLTDFSKKHNLKNKFVFLENYDMTSGKLLVQGVDVWLNTPIKPKEASGTSGMKAGMNGVLNLSVLDGWWAECFKAENGWAITAGENFENAEIRDQKDAEQIYQLLESQIMPMYYENRKKWNDMMRNSIQNVTKNFNMQRMLNEYTEKFYRNCLEN